MNRRWSVERIKPADPALGALWTSLQALGGVSCPFLTWQWFSSLAEISELTSEVLVAVVSESGTPVGLLPLERSQLDDSLRAVGVAAWTWMTPDHLDVVAAEKKEDVARAVVEHLLEGSDWDVLDLDGLTSDGALARATRVALRPPKVALRKPEDVIAPYVHLEDRTAEQLLPGRKLSKRVRKDLADAEAGGGGWAVDTDPNAVVHSLEKMIRLHRARYASEATTFGNEARRAFHLLAAERMARDGMARMYRLFSESGDIALEYDLVFRDKLYAYSAGMDTSARGSPGVALTGQIILAAAEEGLSEYDMLRGDEPYKLRFASDRRVDLRLRALRLSPRTVLTAGRHWLRSRSPKLRRT